MTTVHHTPIVAGASNDPATVNTPLGQLDAALMAEAAARQGADTTERNERIANDSAESAARISADNAEIAARIAGDNAQAAARIAAINAEASARVAGDGILSDRIDDLIIVGGGDPGPEVTAARTAVPYIVGDPPATLGEALAYAAGEVHNVQAYGAAGDGATDDTAAIQAALDAAAGDGGVVLLPRPAYLVTGTLTLTGNDVTIVGNTTTITQDTDYTSILIITGHRNTVRGITFVGTETGDQGATNADTWNDYGAGIVNKWANDNTVEYCTFVDCGARSSGSSPRGHANTGAGVYVSGGENITVQHCKFIDCIMGIGEDDWTNTSTPFIWCKGNKYLHNEFSGCWRPIIVDYGAAHNGATFIPPLIHGNRMINPPATSGTLDARGVLISVFNCEQGFRITDNTIEGNWVHGIAFFLGGRRAHISGNVINGAQIGIAMQSSSYVARDNVVANNTLYNCQRGIALYGIQTSTFSGNVIRGCTTGAGITATDFSRGLLITGNTISHGATYGIRLSKSWGITIANNNIAFNSQSDSGVYAGIHIDGDGWAGGLLIRGNTFDWTYDNTDANPQGYAVKADFGFFVVQTYKKAGIVEGNYFGRGDGVSEPNPGTNSGFLVRDNVFADNRDEALIYPYYEGRLSGSKGGIANNIATNLADITIGGVGALTAGYLVSLAVSGGATSSTQVWIVTQGFNAASATKLSEALYSHSSIALTATADTGNRKVRLGITQVNGSAQACTVAVAVRPLIAQGNPAIMLTML